MFNKQNSKLNSLKYCRRSLAAASAEGYQCVFRLPPLQLMDRGDTKTTPAVPHRVSQRHGAAIDVEFRHVGLDLFRPSKRDWRKSLVHFEEIDVVYFQACHLEYFRCRCHGAGEH